MNDIIREKAKKIKLLAFDVDGVMTTGEVTYDQNGIEYKSFNVKDGHGLVRVQKAGFITGENICIDGGMTKQMIYHGDCGWRFDI